MLILEQVFAGSFQRDSPGFQHIRPIRQSKRHLGILLVEQDRRAARMEIPDDVGDLLHEDGREPE